LIFPRELPAILSNARTETTFDVRNAQIREKTVDFPSELDCKKSARFEVFGGLFLLVRAIHDTYVVF
jgi:hypothetical protein